MIPDPRDALLLAVADLAVLLTPLSAEQAKIPALIAALRSEIRKEEVENAR